MFALLSVAGLAGCSKEDAVTSVVINPVSPAPNEDVDALRQQFHGKYELRSSTSSEPLDVNLDGTPSTNMLDEIPELQLDNRTKYNVEMRIVGPSQYDPNPSFSFVQWWPEQSVRLGSKYWDNNEPIAYNPALVLNYDFQSTLRKFSISQDLKKITVIPSENENPFRWQRPESVTVNADGTIQVVNKRRLYTSAGVKDVVITTVYKRYTMAT